MAHFLVLYPIITSPIDVVYVPPSLLPSLSPVTHLEESSHGMDVGQWGFAVSKLQRGDTQGPDIAAHVVTVVQLLLTRDDLAEGVREGLKGSR